MLLKNYREHLNYHTINATPVSMDVTVPTDGLCLRSLYC